MDAKRSLEEPIPLWYLVEHGGKVATDEMARRLRKLAERHKRMMMREDDLPYIDAAGRQRCAGCSKVWPCPDAEILEGRDGR